MRAHTHTAVKVTALTFSIYWWFQNRKPEQGGVVWLRRALCEGPRCTGWIQKGSLTGAHPLHSQEAQARQWGGAWARLSRVRQLQTIQLAWAVTQIKSHLSLSEGFSLRRKGNALCLLVFRHKSPLFFGNHLFQETSRTNS